MTYHIRKWCEGETHDLKLHVCDENGRAVFSSASYDECVIARDRLNHGAVEAQRLVRENRYEVRQQDGTVKVVVTPREIPAHFP